MGKPLPFCVRTNQPTKSKRAEASAACTTGRSSACLCVITTTNEPVRTPSIAAPTAWVHSCDTFAGATGGNESARPSVLVRRDGLDVLPVIANRPPELNFEPGSRLVQCRIQYMCRQTTHLASCYERAWKVCHVGLVTHTSGNSVIAANRFACACAKGTILAPSSSLSGAVP